MMATETRTHVRAQCVSPPPSAAASSIAPGESGGAFFYLMATGEVTAIPVSEGFNERLVLLDDVPYFEASGPLAAEDTERAGRFRRLFRARGRVVRVLYTASVEPRAVDGLAFQVMGRRRGLRGASSAIDRWFVCLEQCTRSPDDESSLNGNNVWVS